MDGRKTSLKFRFLLELPPIIMPSVKTLEKRIQLPAVIAISVGAMLGSGIFVLPGLAAAKTGPSVWLAFVVAGLCVLPAALSKSELATAMPVSGGTYIYLERTFGPLLGTIVGLGLWISLLLKGSAALVGFGAYLIVLAPLPLKPIALIFIVMIVLLNIRGIRKVSQVQVIIISISLAFLLFLILAGLYATPTPSASDFFPHGKHGFLSAVAFVFISYAGVTKVAAIAEEIHNPEKNLPLGILISLGIITLVYGGVTYVLVRMVPMENLQTDLHPVYSLAHNVGGPTVGIIAAVIGVFTLTSMANVGLLAASRFPFAMSRDNLLPSAFKKLHHRYLTPSLCIFSSGIIMALVILFLEIENIAKLASAFIIILYMFENLAVLILRELRVQWYKPTYRSPLYPWAQIFGILSGAILLVAMGILTIIVSIAVILPGVILYASYGRQRTKRKGVVGQRRLRQELLQLPPIQKSLTRVEFHQDAAAIIPLFGQERSPERLVDIANCLCEGGRIEVIHLTEIPEQATLDAITNEDPWASAIRRRVHIMAAQENLNLSFETIVSRDILKTVHEISGKLNNKWLLMDWGGRSRHTITLSSPLGWLKDHLSCNLASFSDAGVEHFKKILVHVEPGPHDSLVVRTADHLAQSFEADLTFVRYIPEKTSAADLQSQADYLDQIQQLCHQRSETLILRGRNEFSTIGKATVDFDLLVTSGDPWGNVWTRFFGSARDRLTENAGCSVLRLLTPRAQTHEAFSPQELKTDGRKHDLLQFISPEFMGMNLELTKKEALFEYFSKTFAKLVEQAEEGDIVDALWKREKIQNTAIGNGIALPHATLPNVDQTYLGIFSTQKPIDYQSPDERGVEFFFITIGPSGDRQIHLLLLATLSKLVLQTPLLEKLKKAKNAQEVMATLKECQELLSD